MKIQNTNPLGAVDLPAIGRTIEAGEVFEVPDKLGAALLEQTGNYAKPKTTTPDKGTTPEG